MECVEEALLTYSYNTDGRLFNKFGNEVGSYTRKYGRLYLLGKTISISRVLWWMHYGRWPIGEIDHVDGDTHNNSLDNLRECTRGDNAKNRRAYSVNSSGYKGVVPIKYKDKITGYYSKIQSGGKSHYLGSFKTLEQAASAYNEACRELHGDFATLNIIERDI